MLYCNRTDLSEGIDVAKSNNSNKCMVYHYWFFNHGFKFQDSLCNGYHDLTKLCLNISNITVKGAVFHCNIHNFNKSEAIHLLENPVLYHRWYI